ncbi:hypothetical protein CEXT_237051 [Caerostris extrusa]|uniref:Uncharacterized protein n=1 Tax=Caerostris extrusa TaxID=172846 RepID=A0AAV4Y820_CAEEX|nr:hypothetical protein CEXT_237051 [Caerostris extrusa]
MTQEPRLNSPNHPQDISMSRSSQKSPPPVQFPIDDDILQFVNEIRSFYQKKKIPNLIDKLCFLTETEKYAKTKQQAASET